MEVQRGVENVELYFGGNNHVVRPTVRMSCYLSICWAYRFKHRMRRALIANSHVPSDAVTLSRVVGRCQLAGTRGWRLPLTYVNNNRN